MIGAFKYLARFSLFIPLTLFFLYNIYSPLYEQARCLAQLVDEVYCKHWDLGSIPRSPHIFHNFYPNVFPCSVHQKAYHTSSHVSLPRAHDHSSNGHRMNSRIHPSQPAYTQAGKSNKALFNGPDYCKTPPFGPENPPWFVYFSILFSFLFLILLVILI